MRQKTLLMDFLQAAAPMGQNTRLKPVVTNWSLTWPGRLFQQHDGAFQGKGFPFVANYFCYIYVSTGSGYLPLDLSIPTGIFIVGGTVFPTKYNLPPAIEDAEAFYFLDTVSFNIENIIGTVAIGGKGIGNIYGPLATGDSNADVIGGFTIILSANGKSVAGIFIGNETGAAAGIATETGSWLPVITDHIIAGNGPEVDGQPCIYSKIGAKIYSWDAAYSDGNSACIIGAGIGTIAHYLVDGRLQWRCPG